VRGTRTTCQIELDEFDQIFERPDRSHVVIALRATLRGGDGSRSVLAFVTEQPASTPDAAGGARALTQASDELIQRIIDWVASARSGAPPEQAASLKAIPAKMR
jgi:cholesterol transport system auxiliary component